MSDSALEIHQAIIDEHRRRPRHRGPLPTANRAATRENPACGDRCTLQLQVDDERIAAAHFTGAGCALSQASASLATVALTGRTATEARALAAAVDSLVRSGGEPRPPLTLDDELAALVLAHAYPARHACALLAWQAALAALEPTPLSA